MDAIGTAQKLTRDTNLRISGWSSAAVTVTVAVRRLNTFGELIVDEHELIITSAARLKTQITKSLAEGYLLSVQPYVSTGTVVHAQTFVRVELIEGLTGAIRSSSTLVEDYVTADIVASWPGSILRAPTEGPGWLRHIQGTDPAAGSEILETVPARARWRLHHFGFTFVASGAVANRRPVLTIDDGLQVQWQTSSAIDVTAGQTAIYRAGMGTPFFTWGTLRYHLPLPTELKLFAGANISTVTAAIDGADNYGAPFYTVEEWIDP